MEAVITPDHAIRKLISLLPTKNARMRPRSSVASPQVKTFSYELTHNQRSKQSSNNIFNPAICKTCKQPKTDFQSVDSSIYCNCPAIKLIRVPAKQRPQRKTSQSIPNGSNAQSSFIFASQKPSGLPVDSRKFSLLNQTIDNTTLKRLKSNEVLNETTVLSKKIIKKDDVNKQKFLVYKGNNSGLVKKLMELRTNWCEGYYSLPASASFIWMPTSYNIRFERLKASCAAQMVNHFEFHTELSNKSRLFHNLTNHCTTTKTSLNSLIPVTFVIDFRNGHYFSQVHNFKVFMINTKTKGLPSTHYIGKNIWIMKPAGYNRGRGIHVFDDFDRLDDFVKEIIANKTPGSAHTYVIQKYIEQPLLVHQRKFDIRVWVLVTQSHNCYFFPQGYLRTSSSKFTLDHLESAYIHLTNNAIQKEGAEYGKFEAGNQMSFKDFQEYLYAHYGNIRLASILAVMKSQITASLLAVKGKLNSNLRLNCFEIFGYDFIIDACFKPWLIEVNTNPCLELSSPLLEQIIPRMIDDALELTVGVVFPSPKIPLVSQNIIDLPQGNLWEFLVSISNQGALIVSGINLC